MCEVLCSLLLFGSIQLCPDVLEAGLFVHKQELARPEITGMPNPLFVGSAQWVVHEKPGRTVSIVIEHTSSATRYEVGYGLNTVGVRVRYD